MIDIARLKQIKERLQRVSKGDWKVVEQKCADLLGDEYIYYIRIAIETPNGWIAVEEGDESKDDYEFMANARQDIPWLIEQLEILIND